MGMPRRFGCDPRELVGCVQCVTTYSPVEHVRLTDRLSAGLANFNKSLAGFLAVAGAAGAPFGYGWGFQYDCEAGGWLRDFPDLERPLGPPAGPPTISHVTPPPSGRGAPAAVFTRRFRSGVRAFFNATAQPRDSNSCIEWTDGARTDGNGGCARMDAWASGW